MGVAISGASKPMSICMGPVGQSATLVVFEMNPGAMVRAVVPLVLSAISLDGTE